MLGHNTHACALTVTAFSHAGHGDSRWLTAVIEQAKVLTHTSNLFHTVPQVLWSCGCHRTFVLCPLRMVMAQLLPSVMRVLPWSLLVQLHVMPLNCSASPTARWISSTVTRQRRLRCNAVKVVARKSQPCVLRRSWSGS